MENINTVRLRIKKLFHASDNGFPFVFDSIYGLGIAFRTQSDCVHSELEVPYIGKSFSARDDGSTWKEIKYSHPGYWYTFEIDIRALRLKNPETGKPYKDIFELIELGNKLETANKGYSWGEIVLYEGVNTGFDDPLRWYCSEVTSYLLGVQPSKINPGQQKARIEKMFGRKCFDDGSKKVKANVYPQMIGYR